MRVEGTAYVFSLLPGALAVSGWSNRLEMTLQLPPSAAFWDSKNSSRILTSSAKSVLGRLFSLPANAKGLSTYKHDQCSQIFPYHQGTRVA